MLGLFSILATIVFHRIKQIKLLEYDLKPATHLPLYGLSQMSKDTISKEEQILQVMRKVLTQVAKDTYTPSNLKHPLSEGTINGIRDCLSLITSREAELAKEAGRENNMKPRYVDEPSSSVVVKLDTKSFKSKKD